MREMFGHTAGKVFLAVLLLTVIGMIYVPRFLTEPVLLFGWMTPHFVVGLVFLIIWLLAYLVYFFGFWPFRK